MRALFHALHKDTILTYLPAWILKVNFKSLHEMDVYSCFFFICNFWHWVICFIFTFPHHSYNLLFQDSKAFSNLLLFCIMQSLHLIKELQRAPILPKKVPTEAVLAIKYDEIS